MLAAMDFMDAENLEAEEEAWLQMASKSDIVFLPFATSLATFLILSLRSGNLFTNLSMFFPDAYNSLKLFENADMSEDIFFIRLISSQIVVLLPLES